MKRLSARRENPGRFFIAAAQGRHERESVPCIPGCTRDAPSYSSLPIAFSENRLDFRARAVVQRSIKVTLKKLRLLFRAEAAL